MPKSILFRFSTCLATLFAFTNCTSETPAPATCAPGDVGCVATGGNLSNATTTETTTGGTSSVASSTSGGSTSSSNSSSSVGGSTSAGGTTSGTATSSVGGSSSVGGTTNAGGSSSATGGATSAGGNSSGGTSSRGGTSSTSTTSTGGTTSTTSSTSTGGTTSTTNNTSTGGTTTSTTTAATGGTKTDSSGVPLASKGDKKTGSREFLNLGDMRIINNRWGSDEWGCNTASSVFVNADGSLGWDFDRGNCDVKDTATKPDYPEIEFGVHPFGAGSDLETSPPYSSTTLLPLQIKNINSASVTVDNLNINLQKAASWNLNFEMWLSQGNPLEANPGVYAELIVFWGWEDNRWGCLPPADKVSSGGKGYTLCHQSDTWADGKWRYFQFNVDGGPLTNFSGKIDVKPFLDYLVSSRLYSADLWVTRFEIGTEIDDETRGSASVKNVTFEVNGTSKSVELAN